MRTLFRIISVCLLMALLAACGKKEPEKTTAATEQHTEKAVEKTTEAAYPETEAAQPETEKETEPESSWQCGTLDAEIVFSTVDMEGKAYTEEDFFGRLTMINYWAYWCGPCVGEMPDLQKLYEEYKDRGFMLWGISNQEYEEDNLKTISRLGITYPCLRYTADFDEALQTGYIPTTVFVDAEGRIVGEKYIGSRSYEDWKAIVEALLP